MDFNATARGWMRKSNSAAICCSRFSFRRIVMCSTEGGATAARREMIHDSQNAATESDLDERTADSDPLHLFQLWFSDAINAKLPLPEGMTLATATRDGSPSARLVLLKQVDAQGFVFFTNYQSQKATELEENPVAELVFWWPTMERQIRIHGSVARIAAAESDRYFRTRPRESQLGALASPQSEVIADRDVLEKRFAELEK